MVLFACDYYEVYDLFEKLFHFHSTTLQYMLNDKRSLQDPRDIYISS